MTFAVATVCGVGYGCPMWRLLMAAPGEAWAQIDNFDSVTAAAEKIRTLEGYPVSGIFLEVLIETIHGDEAEAFAHLEHTGRTTGRAYVIKRVAH